MLERLEQDMKSAMKSGDKRRVATIRLLLATLKNEKIQAQRALTDEEVEGVLRRAVKQRKDSIEQYARGGRQDLVDGETAELAIIEEYLPQGLSESDIEEAILKLSPGQYSSPFRSKVGYHLFFLDSKETMTGDALVQARNQIRDILYRQKYDARMQEWVAEIRQRAVIEIRM